MNFTLNGRTVTVEWVDVDTRGGTFGVRITINHGFPVGSTTAYRRTMADALTYATVATSPVPDWPIGRACR